MIFPFPINYAYSFLHSTVLIASYEPVKLICPDSSHCNHFSKPKSAKRVGELFITTQSKVSKCNWQLRSGGEVGDKKIAMEKVKEL